ncbi:MAG: phosphoserine phosphatase RsbU/P [Bryobacterales bacterium]|nr:phosphoserine phosphatase RsbU/P [Bryobacterales bacterium]
MSISDTTFALRTAQPLLTEDAALTALCGALEPIASIPGFGLTYQSAEGLLSHVYGAAATDQCGEAMKFDLDDSGSAVLLYYREPDSPVGKLLETTIRSVLQRLEVERREKLLMDELGSNWESLEAIYEISADILRFGDVKEALQRLLNRFSSLQEGLEAGLFLTRGGRLVPLVSNKKELSPLEWGDLGVLERPIRENRAIVLNDRRAESRRPGSAPWDEAKRIAAVPITARQKVIGFLAVWRHDQVFEFGAPFCRLLEAITCSASMLLESDRLNRTMRENERLAQEIEIASSIQQTLLFGNPPRNVQGVTIASFSAASQRIDGDFHDFLKHKARCLDVLIGDVMGKGIAAALLGAATKNQFLRAVANLAIRSNETPSPDAIVRRAAGRIEDQLIALDRFVTLCYARFDFDRGMLEFVDCGHTGIILHRKQTGETLFLRGDDLPIGAMPGFTCTQQSCLILQGDSFLMFSDGVTETRSPDGEFFGEERLLDCVRAWSSLGPAILLDEIRKRTAVFSGGQPRTDDFTCIALTVLLGDDERPVARTDREFRCDPEVLADFREWTTGIGATVPDGGLDADAVSQLELACTEAFVNCVTHGSDNDGREPVHATALVHRHYITVELRHKGREFDPLEIPDPAFDGSRDSGFGTYIIFHLADEVKYRRDGDINLISISIMRKKVP